jgi:hypothetical protein
VTLNGRTSSDPDSAPSPLTYSWTQTAGPGVTLTGATTATPSFTAPNVTTPTVLTFRLTVSDGLDTDTDDANVTVNPPGNLAPAANAGTDRSVTTGSLVTLSAAGSSDSDGTIVSYLWTQTSGASITLSGGNTQTATFTPSEAGAYSFRLTVTDNQGATGTDDVTITAQPPDGENQRPVADAGPDQTVVAGYVIYLNAGHSYDPEPGTVLTYAWTQVSGPTVAIESGDTDVAAFVPPEPSTYVFRVTVSDGLLSDDDTATIVAEGTAAAREGLEVIPNRSSLGDIAGVQVVGSADLAGKVYVYTVAGAPVGSLELVEDGASARAELGNTLAAAPGLYIFVAAAGDDGTARLVVTP